ncbi:chemotaxis protein CheA [Methyloversatilis sp.]|uniref:chemotaxis protein CheA n=1 Tax=Methyloversatilis sp. TaxID=2569862 RepID=UPI002734BDA8|nr:chemotaxis protein CheA [Methyloversatilis sp.]MDP3454518.1 chemotaxis protein CheA [Methyloversatilis sp.]MDP3578577.1 chemotaxis protein CheA [Methyloversatilis sp.]
MDLEPALEAFFAEADELLTRMEESLLQLESEPDNNELINDIFRAAHTIKGTAGVFGFDDVVHFTHEVESVLDRVRDGQMRVTNDVIGLLLRNKDHIGVLVRAVAEKRDLDAAQRAEGEVQTAALLALLGKQTDKPAASAVIAAPVDVTRSVPAADDGCENGNWHLSIRFGNDVLRGGMDPLSFLRYMRTLGDIVHLDTLATALPSWLEFDPESCYLGFEIDFRSDATKSEIEGVFEFVREECVLHIIPPYSQVSEYISVLRALPEDDLKLGEMLVLSGALTRSELERGLSLQSEAAANDAEEPATPQQIGEILIEGGAVSAGVVDAALAKQKQVKDTKAQEARSLRIDADKLDQLIELVGELVVASAGVQNVAQMLAQGHLTEASEVLTRLVEEVRDQALSLRMVQIGATFQRFQRVVRDVSRELGKDIELQISGGETDLDKTVVERIGDPLMHLIRNSMDHGIETTDVRLSAGKPARAKVMLNAYHEAGGVVIDVADDGGGLNRAKILRKAIERGLVAEDAQLGEREIDRLIFAPGFSTADQVSNLSGRGVGMDVVRRDIEALRGTVDIDTEPGKGTRIRIRLPLTLAIIDGFRVGIDKASFVLPVDMIVECVELAGSIRDGARTRGYLDMRGEVLPLLWLREAFDMDSSAPERRENVVVVQFGQTKAGIVVDQLMGEHQTVIRPLGKLFSALRGVSGSTILGSGEIALILDVAGLMKMAGSAGATAAGITEMQGQTSRAMTALG